MVNSNGGGAKKRETSQRMSSSIRRNSLELHNPAQASALGRLLNGALRVNRISDSRELLHPCRDGEQIGFSCPILLSVSVYLLIVTEALPEQSDTLPLIGVYYIIIMTEIGLALTVTIVVLKAHHATTEPPAFLKWCLFINKIYRCCRKTVQRRRITKIEALVHVVVPDCDNGKEDTCKSDGSQTNQGGKLQKEKFD